MDSGACQPSPVRLDVLCEWNAPSWGDNLGVETRRNVMDLSFILIALVVIVVFFGGSLGGLFGGS